MATPLTDEGLQNWVKAWMAQKCFKEGILPFIKQQIENQFKDSISHVKRVSKRPEYTCNTCDVKTIKPYHAINQHVCTRKVVQHVLAKTLQNTMSTKWFLWNFIRFLKDRHSQKKPNWLNSRSQFWSRSAWEQIKCFIFTPGYEMKGDIEDSDVTALVQICTNNKDLKALFAGVDIESIIQIREDRNELCHSSSMNVDTTKLKEYVGHIKTALQVNALKGFPEALTQSGILDKLLTENITKSDEIESKREVLRAIDEFKKELEEQNAQDGSDIQVEIEKLRDLYDKHSMSINEDLTVLMEYVVDCQKEVQALGNDMRENRTVLTSIQTTVQQTSAKTDDILVVLRQLLETVQKMNPTDVNIPDLRFVVTVSTQTAEQATEVDALLVDTGNCVLQNTTPATESSQHLKLLMQPVFDEIRKVGDIRSVKKECMAVYISFSTLEKFMHFMEMYFNGSLSELFQPVQDYLREFTNCADITLNLNINEEDTVRSLILIQEQLNNSQAGIDAGPLDIEGRDPVHSYQDRTKDTETQCQQEQLNNSQAGIDAGPLDIEGRDPVHSYQYRTKDTETQCQQEQLNNSQAGIRYRRTRSRTFLPGSDKRHRNAMPTLQVIMAEHPSQSMSPGDSANASQSTPSTVPPPVPFYYHICNAGHAYNIIIIMIIIIIIISNMPPGPYQTSTIPPGQVVMFSSPRPQPFVYPYGHTGQVPPGIGQTVIHRQGTRAYSLATRQQAAIDPSASSAVNAVQKGLHSVKTVATVTLVRNAIVCEVLDTQSYDGERRNPNDDVSRTSLMFVEKGSRSQSNPKVKKATNALEQQHIVQTIAAIELYHAQREVANYLELAYLNLADHQDVVKEVRMTAHAARSQHLMTSGLMKKFTVTAGHIIKTMIPMILDAVELQDRDIIRDAFGQIIQNAESMKKESEDTRTSYLTLQTEVQKIVAFVNDKNKHVKTETERLKVEMEREEQMARAAAQAQRELEEEKKRMEDDLESLNGRRDRMNQIAEGAGRDMSVDNKTFVDVILRPSAAMGGGVGIALDFVGKAVNIFSSMFRGNNKTKTYKALIEGRQAEEDNVYRAQKERRAFVERMIEQRKEKHQRLANIKILSIQQCSVESLREASLHLGDVDRHFTRIIQFWENMAATLKYLNEDVRAGKVYLKQIENEKYADRFKKYISMAEQRWQSCGSDYVQESDTEIIHLYNFLSPNDNMSNSDRTARQKVLISSIEADIDSVFGEGQKLIKA